MIVKEGREIRTLDAWRDLAGPKRADQWSSDRSALEAARTWLAVASPTLPSEVAAALASHSAFGTVTGWQAEPEARLTFDQHRGEPRNSDLLVHARDEHGRLLLAVEAKADEPFGETVGDALASAIERRLANPRSRGVERIEALAAALLGPRRSGEASLGQLRYQLLTAAAGAIAASAHDGGLRVVLLVQEFRTRKTADERHAANARDLDAFVRRVSHGAVPRCEPGVIHGPFTTPGAPLFDAVPPFFVGKVSRDLRPPSI